MNNTFKVAKWEIKKNIRNKSFLFMTFIFPIIIMIIGGGAGYIGGSGSQNGLEIGIIDQTDYIYEELNKSFVDPDIILNKIENTPERGEMKNILEKNNYDSIVFIPRDIIESNQATIYYKELRGLESNAISGFLSNIVIEKRLIERGYSADKILHLTQNINFQSESLQEEESGLAAIFLPLGLAMLMAFSSMFTGSALMQSINKEKSDKLVEILFSSISPKNLMYGKVIGYGILGISQVIIWGAAGSIVANRFFDIPLASLFNIKNAYMFVYFLLGFVMISGLNAIAGAASGKEMQTSGQSLNGLIVLIPIVPLWLSAVFLQNPSGTIARVLSYIPIFTPTTMLLRMGISTPPLWEIILTTAILAITAFLFIKLASKIFRVGMLMYGKSMSIKEIIKWSRI